MAYISQSSIQELTDRLDSITIVSEYARLEKRGGRYWACCPFHQEKTPSFTVNPDMKSFYCFGCQKGGSIINLVMELEKLNFPETVELLAKKTGVELIYEDSFGSASKAEEDAKKKQKENLFELYKRISGTFHHFFLKKPEDNEIKLYILSRGINIEMVKSFRLGYSPPDRYWLYKFLSGKGYSREFLSRSGLFSVNYPELSLFSGRLMFPINDRQGRTVAFGGRILEENTEAPKYINSPELEIYKKRETLYGLDLAILEIRKTKTVYIAEGYMDVIALHQAGITNSIAPLGTAFTEEQARLLRRWAEKVIIFFDSDEAGQNAAVKAIMNCRKNGLVSAVVEEEEMDSEPMKDPAEILKNNGQEALHKKAKCFINDFDYLIKRAKSLYNVSFQDGMVSEGKAKAVAFLFPYIELLESDITKESCIETAADAFGINPAVINSDYRRYVKEEKNPHLPGERTVTNIQMNEELSILMVLVMDFLNSGEESLIKKFRANLNIGDFDDLNAKDLLIAMEECYRYGETGMDKLLERITSTSLRKMVLEGSATGEFSINKELYISDGIKKLREKRLNRQQEEIIIKLRKAKNNHEDDEAKELLAEKMHVDNELYQLKQGR